MYMRGAPVTEQASHLTNVRVPQKLLLKKRSPSPRRDERPALDGEVGTSHAHADLDLASEVGLNPCVLESQDSQPSQLKARRTVCAQGNSATFVADVLELLQAICFKLNPQT